MPRPRSPEKKQRTLDPWIKEEEKQDAPLETLPGEEQKKKPIEEKMEDKKVEKDKEEKPKKNNYYGDDKDHGYLRPFS